MPTQNAWMNHTSGAASFFTCDMDADIVLGSMMSLSAPLGTATQGDDGGQLYDKTRSITSQAPIISVTTKAIDDALATLTPDGICICSDGATKYGARVYGQARKTCGENGVTPGDSEHLLYEVNWGLATPQTLTGTRGGDMSLSYQIDCLSNDDGSNAPYAIRENVALPADPNLGQFTLGSMVVGDIIMDDITDFSLDFGVQIAEKLPGLGQIWPRTLSISKSQPVLTLTGRNPRILDDFNTAGLPAGRVDWLGNPAIKTDTIFRFRKRKNQGTFEDDAATVHVEIAMHGLLVVDNPFDASGSARANTTLRILGIEDPATGGSPLTIRTGVAYSEFAPTP